MCVTVHASRVYPTCAYLSADLGQSPRSVSAAHHSASLQYAAQRPGHALILAPMGSSPRVTMSRKPAKPSLPRGGAADIRAAGPAAVAQPVEHRIRNAGVGGSNPFRGTIPSHPPARVPAKFHGCVRSVGWAKARHPVLTRGHRLCAVPAKTGVNALMLPTRNRHPGRVGPASLWVKPRFTAVASVAGPLTPPGPARPVSCGHRTCGSLPCRRARR